MGRSEKCFDLQNPLNRPATGDLLIEALLVFANGGTVAIWGQRGPFSEIRRWSRWRDVPSAEERTAHVNFLQSSIDDSWGALGFFRTDSSGRRRPSNAVIELSGFVPAADSDLLPDQNLYMWLAHMNASIEPQRVLVGHSGGYSLTDYRCFKNVSSALAVAMLLVVDQNKPYAAALCRCKLPRCQNFYLARKNPNGGPPNRTYCDPAHRDEHHNSGRRKEEQMIAEHFIDIVRPFFPKSADIVRADQSGNLRLLIDWRLRTDPARPNKRSKPIELCISREAIDDYQGSNARQRANADQVLARHIQARLKSFNPEHQTPREIVPPRERWVIDTGMINL